MTSAFRVWEDSGDLPLDVKTYFFFLFVVSCLQDDVAGKEFVHVSIDEFNGLAASLLRLFCLRALRNAFAS